MSPVNTPYLGSGLTTWFPSAVSVTGPVDLQSTLSVRGATTLHGALNSASALSGGAITGTTGVLTSTLSVGGAARFDSTLSADGAATFSGTLTANGAGHFQSTLSARGALSVNGFGPMTLVSLSSTSIVATTCVANTSTSTNYTDNLVAVGDVILIGPGSSLSQGISLQAVVSSNSAIAFRYSNCSTAAANQVAINCKYAAWRWA